ncbi:MAG TPA: S8 family serine peptidase [Candidatus Polarisedimenticolaceae bacterium]
MYVRRLFVCLALACTAVAAAPERRVVEVPDAGIRYAVWSESGERFVAFSRDGGASWTRPRAMDLSIPLRFARLLPGEDVPAAPAGFSSRAGNRLYLVQFETPGLEAYRRILRDLGAEVLQFVPHQSHVLRMDPDAVAAVAAQPFVRWIGPYEPAYRIEPEVLREILGSDASREARRYHVMSFLPGLAEKSALAEEIRAIGGRVDLVPANGYRLEATLSLEQVALLAHSNRLQWIDRWTPRETDMDIVREQAGENYVESVGGYSGQGVRGEVMDAGVEQTHPDFDGILLHGGGVSVDSHGTSTYGIVFGNGNRDGDGNAQGLGSLPSKAAGYFADYDALTDRYQHTAEIVASPIFGLFQSNSWGDARTRAYTSISQEMDDIIWIHDLAIFQSQSNAGNQDSRPQAWAKNIISIGAVEHYNTRTLADDCWCFSGSIGPAADGRIKPDLAYWYDSIYTTTTGGGYTTGFGGTSAATPISAGIGGLIFQMWGANVLGNNPQGATLFDKRPHAATLKAMMINTAEPYPFTGSGADLGRFKQGWGLPSASRFLDRAPRMKVVDEERSVAELEVHAYTATVPAGMDELKVTLAYTDRAGTTSSTLHRINDVSLKVTSPSGAVVYHGNFGLDAGNWSASGGAPDGINNVENVFVQAPAAGLWTIEISGDDINLDQNPSTPVVDQDYALVVYGVTTLDFGCLVQPAPASGLSGAPSGDNAVALSWTGTPTAAGYRVYRAAGGCGGSFAQVGGTLAAATTFTDTSASGGRVYGYTVRAVEGCEAEPSNCVEVTATGPCILPPAFAGAVSATDVNAAQCGVTVAWGAATPACGGSVAYNVYRGTSAAFVPSTSNRVASCVTGTSFVDGRALTSNQSYWYVVRAVDLGGRGSAECGGVGETNAVKVTARPRGPIGNLISQDFEAGLGAWTVQDGAPAAGAGDFLADIPVGSTDGGLQANPASCPQGARCLFTGKNKGGNPNNGDVDDGETQALSPVFDASSFSTAQLTFQRWHYHSGNFNDSADRFGFEVSRDGGTTWQSLDALTGSTSANAWTPRSFDLETTGALTSQMRVRARSADGPNFDSVVESAVDDVRVVGFQTCTSPAPGAPGATTGTLLVDRDTDSSRLKLSWGPECGGGTGYSVYRGDLAAGWGSAAPLPGFCGVAGMRAFVSPDAGSYFFIVAPNDGATEGSLGLRSDGTRRPRPTTACLPEAPAVNACAP